MFEEEIRTLRSMRLRDAVSQVILLLTIVTSALILWKILILACFSESPIVVVLSGSMEPGYERGDLLLLTTPQRSIEVGDICVFKLEDRETPIVHRIHRVHQRTMDEAAIVEVERSHGVPASESLLASPHYVRPAVLPSRTPVLPSHSGKKSMPDEDGLYVLTKGDNNHGDDRVLYDPGQEWIHSRHIVGRSTVYVPFVGMLTILLAENLWLRYIVLAALGFFVLTSKEEQH